MRRRMDSYDVKGELVATIDYLNAKVGPPPRQVFEMPLGYKRGYHRRKRVISEPCATLSRPECSGCNPRAG